MKNLVYTVEGIKCGGCSSKIQNRFNSMSEVVSVEIALETKEVKVSIEDSLSPMTLKKELEGLGFQVVKMEKI